MSEEQEALCVVPVPALVAELAMFEKKKGSPLTEEEVLSIRGKCICITMRASAKQAMDTARGYRDLDPENVWEEWQEARKQLAAE